MSSLLSYRYMLQHTATRTVQNSAGEKEHLTALLVNLTNPPATLNRCQLHQTARFFTSLPS